MSIISSETKSHGEGQGHYSGMLFRVIILYFQLTFLITILVFYTQAILCPGFIKK